MSDIANTITREQLVELPVRRYEGPVCLVATTDDLHRAMHEIRHDRVIGIDTETQPAFRKGQTYPPSLVQIATAREVFIFQLRRQECLAALAEVLENPAIVKAGIGLADDLRKLKTVFPFEEKNIIHLDAVIQRHGIVQSGVRNLAGLFLGFRITKGSRTSNWGRSHLTPNQIIYAATDAWVCRELFLCFEKRGLLASARRPDAV
ncbi:MAG: 3'-5' exonuclease domain-containing protein 2 [Verrucomicrobiae bacterium]|nr:3'-5' exonuclease domain-containing protein 2 [Verrucomicrobiae bacterium]